MGNPCFVVEIPLDRLQETGLEGFLRCPAEFTADLAGVDCVALVVAGAVGDIGLEGAVRLAICPGAEVIQQGAEGVDDLEVGLFVMAADVVDLAQGAFLKHQTQGPGMIIDVEPVADVVAFAVDGQGFARYGVMNHEGNELFRELAGAVVVGAVGGNDREAVGMVPGADEVIGGSLGGGVRGVRLIGGGLGKESGVP